MVSFTIGVRGQVAVSNVKESTLGENGAAKCIAEAVRKLQFPAPSGGGIVIVTYPFVFTAPR